MKKTYLTPVSELYEVDLKAVLMVSGGDFENLEEGARIGDDEN